LTPLGSFTSDVQHLEKRGRSGAVWHLIKDFLVWKFYDMGWEGLRILFVDVRQIWTTPQTSPIQTKFHDTLVFCSGASGVSRKLWRHSNFALDKWFSVSRSKTYKNQGHSQDEVFGVIAPPHSTENFFNLLEFCDKKNPNPFILPSTQKMSKLPPWKISGPCREALL